MPFTGEVDISGILQTLGDPDHGLRPAKPLDSLESRDEIFRATWGAVDMSTSMALSVIPKVVWDVNGYYRSLGITWPFTPTKKELREGYQAADGQSSERLTYNFKQLLDPSIRAEYDAMPLGSHYRDKYAVEEDVRKLSSLAKKLSEDEGRMVTIDELLDEAERSRPKLPPQPESDHRVWDWGFYALQSRKYDSEPLEEWQQYLTKAFSAAGLEEVISIGYIGKTEEPATIRHHDNRTVIFLNENTHPTPELAEAMTSEYKLKKGKND